MADIAIDQTEIRAPATSVAPVRPAFRRKTVLVAGSLVLGIAAIGGATAAIISKINLPAGLSGLAFLPTPEAPRRSEIRIGRLPDMPEIRDGVPAVIGTKAAPRVVETSPPIPAASGPRQVAVVPVPAAILPRAPLPTTFAAVAAPQLAQSTPQAPGPARVETVALTSTDSQSAPAPIGVPSLPSGLSGPEQRPGPRPAAFKPEPVSTASVSNTAVPLPPPAPVRSLAARPPEAKAEKPASRPAQLASRPAPQPVAPAETASPPAPPAEDRVEILGLKLPNGSDWKNAVSSIGEALNLPKAF